MVGAEDAYTLVDAEQPITVRHLLTHTSGLGYRFMEYPALSEYYKKKGISDGLSQTEGTLADYVEEVAKMPLLHQPGEAFSYGINSDVLGRLVEIWSGHFLGDFMEERIFKPLKLKSQ